MFEFVQNAETITAWQSLRSTIVLTIVLAH